MKSMISSIQHRNVLCSLCIKLSHLRVLYQHFQIDAENIFLYLPIFSWNKLYVILVLWQSSYKDGKTNQTQHPHFVKYCHLSDDDNQILSFYKMVTKTSYEEIQTVLKAQVVLWKFLNMIKWPPPCYTTKIKKKTLDKMKYPKNIEWCIQNKNSSHKRSIACLQSPHKEVAT